MQSMSLAIQHKPNQTDNRQPIEGRWGLKDTNDPWVGDNEPTEVYGQTRQNCAGGSLNRQPLGRIIPYMKWLIYGYYMVHDG